MNLSFDEWKADELKEFLKGTTWRVAVNEKGKTYYYHKIKKTSQWSKPDDIKEFEDTLTDELFLAHRKCIELESSGYGDDSSFGEDKEATVPAATREVMPVIQKVPVKIEAPKVLTKAELDQIIERKDSILEPSAISTAKALIQDHHAAPEDIVQKLANSYNGFPAMSRMLVEWIKLVKVLELKQSAAHLNTTSLAHYGSDFYGEEVLSSHLAELLKLRFNRKGADALVTQPDTSSSGPAAVLPVVPAYVHTLLQNDNYKAALTELYTVHDQSTLLQAVCSGKYTTPTSGTAIENSAHSVSGAGGSDSAAAVDSRSAYEVLVSEVGVFEQVRKLLKDAAAEVSAASAREQLVRLVAASSETVKEHTLQLLGQIIRQLGERKQGGGSGSCSGGGAEGGVSAASSDSRKRAREDDDGVDVSGGDSSSSDGNKRVRTEDGSRAAASNGSVLHASLTALHHTILHTNSCSDTCVESTNGSVFGGDKEIGDVVERVVRTQSVAVEDAVFLSEHFSKSTTQPSATLAHPSLLQVLVSAYTNPFTHAAEYGADSLKESLCTLLGLGALYYAQASGECVGAIPDDEGRVTLEGCKGMVEGTYKLCRLIQESFYGVIPEDRVAHLKEQLVARCPVCAALAVRFASLHTSWGSANASNTDFVGVLPVLCGVVQSAAEAHPAVHAHCLAALKLIMACAGSILKAGELEDAAKVSVLTKEVGMAQRLVLDLCIKLISFAHQSLTLMYLVSVVSDLDIEMVRYVLHGLLGLPERLTLFSSLSAATMLVELLHCDICLRAIGSKHFGPAGRASLGVLVQQVSAMDALDDTTRRKCADLSAVQRQ